MRPGALEEQSAALFDLPCACQNLRRVTRVVTRIYDEELRKAGLEITHFGLLTALAATEEANQKRLSAGFAMDSTTLTRTLRLLLKQGWVRVRRGKDRREHLFRLTQDGKGKMAEAQRHWDRGGTATAQSSWRRGLEKHEADGLANHRGRDDGVNFLRQPRELLSQQKDRREQ